MNDPYAEDHRRAMERLEKLSPAERRELLRRAGIIDSEGRLSKRYLETVEKKKELP